MVSAAVLAIQIPGNVTVGGAVIGNNRPQGKSLGRCGKLPNASSAWQKPARNLRKALVNQCFGMAHEKSHPPVARPAQRGSFCRRQTKPRRISAGFVRL